jgi:diguanylate cyclase (GGDEF)-like protein
MLNTLHANEQIDEKYLILSKLGKGGMSVVYRALDQESNKEVALKLLNPTNTLPYLELVVKFRNEVQVISKLNHPNIIKFHTTGNYNNIPYLVTEVLEGDSLAGLLKKGVKFSINESLALIGKVAEALHCVHTHNIIHRDVKPSNIFVVNSRTDKPKIKLLDFGLAHIMELSNFEKNENMSGTFSYMSPEATGIIRKPLDERSDLYSVGVILYYLLTGQLPFQSTTAAELLHQIAAMKAAPLHRFNPHLPDVTVQIVNRLLAKDQDERYQSANGLLHDISRYLKGEQDFTIGEGDRNEIRLTYQTKLVGREKELTRIKGLINKAARKQGGICLIGGEPGVGKTRLVKAIKEYVYIRGYNKGEIFIESHCMAQENKVPYQAFKHALDEFIQKTNSAGAEEKAQETKRIQELAGELGAVLIKLNPNLKELLGQVPELPSLDLEKENIRFTITAAHFICNLVREDQVGILFLDDLQWADEGSLRLLEHIAPHIEKTNLLILGTYRSNEIDEQHGLAQIKKNAENRGYAVTDIQIEPLAHDRIQNMVANLLKEKNDRVHDFAQYISDKAGGNPFFTITLLKEIVEQNAIVWDQGACTVDQDKINQLHLPDNIIDMMLLRTKEIPKELERLLEISAVIGKEFKLYLLYELIQKDHTAILHLIDQAVKRNLLEYSLSDRGKIQFVHDRIREAFLTKIPHQKRSKYHLKTANLLLKHHKDDTGNILFELAYHLMKGGDEEKGLTYTLRAGQSAKGNHAHQDSISYYNYAKKILNKKNDKSEQYINLLENLGESYRLAGNFENSLKLFNESVSLISTSDLDHKSRIFCKIGDTLFEKGETDKSFHMLERAVQLTGIKVPQSTFAIHISLLIEFSFQMLHTLFPNFFIKKIYRKERDNTVALRALNRLYEGYAFLNIKKGLYCHLKSLNTAEKIGPSSNLAHCYVLGGIIWSLAAWKSRALRDSNLGLKTAIQINDKAQEGFAYLGLSIVLLMLNRTQEGLDYSRKAINVLKGLGEYWELGVAYVFRIQNCIFTGELNEALEASEDFYDLSKEVNAIQNLGWSLMMRGKVLALNGNLSKNTIDEIKRSTVLMKETKDKVNFLFSLSILSSAFLREKKYYSAISTTREVKSLFLKNYGYGSWILDLLPLGAQVYLDSIVNIPHLSMKEKKGYLREAQWFCKKSLKLSKKFKFISGWTYQINGTYNWLVGKKEAAIRDWQTGIIFLREQTGDTYRLGYILMEMSSFLLHSKDIDYIKISKRNLAEAQNIFKEIGAAADYKKTLSLLGIQETLPSGQEIFHEQETTPQQRFSSERKIMTALETSRYLSSILDLDELLEKIMDKAIELLGAEKGILFLYPEDRNRPKELEVRVSRNVECIDAESDTFFTSRSIIKKVEKEKEPLIIEDAVTDYAFKEQSSVINYGLRSVLCVPIQHRNTLLGAIYLDNRMISGLFNKEDLWVLELISSQAGVSIENARLFKKSVMDALTGIYNRAYFDNFLLHSVEDARKNSTKLSLMLIDVDNFKIFNDTYGHQIGDVVLQSVAEKIRSKVRKHDMAARYGGDEFVVILPNTDKNEARQVGEALNKAVHEHKVKQKVGNRYENLNITVSIGIAELTGNDRTELVENADKALYQVKELGRNCVVVWEQTTS